MVGSPYPYLSQLQGINSASLLQLTSLSAVNAQYRRNSPNYRDFSDKSAAPTAAQKQLQDYQAALSASANPYAAQGSGYNAVDASTIIQSSDDRIGSLLSQLNDQGFTKSPFSGSGSRYVISDVILYQDGQNNTGQPDYTNPNGSRSRRGKQYRLHYYQDSAQEIVLLQDTSNRQSTLSLNETTRGTLDYIKRTQNILGTTAPSLYGSGRSQAKFGYNSNQDLLVVRKAGDTQYRAQNVDETGIGTGSSAKSASTFLEQRLARLNKVHQIQNSVDSAVAANNNFIINTPRSQLNREKTRKDSENVVEFFPGLRQGFGFNNSNSNTLAASQVIRDHYRAQYNQFSQSTSEGVARANANGGINTSSYTDFSALTQSRKSSDALPSVLPFGNRESRYSHLEAGSVLQISNFQNVISNDDSASTPAARYRSDTYQDEDSLVSGRIGLIDAAQRSDRPHGGALKAPAREPGRGFSLITNIAGDFLNSLSGVINVENAQESTLQKLGLGSTGSLSSEYEALLQGNVDVSSTLIDEISDSTSQSSIGLYSIDIIGIGERFNSRLDINWQPNIGQA